MTTNRKIVVAVLLTLGAALVLLHGWILRRWAESLIVDEPADHYDYVAVFDFNTIPDGDRCMETAVELARRCSAGILVLQPGMSRVVEVGAQPSFETVCRGALAKSGFPEKDIHVLQRDGNDVWSAARALQTWLVQHPNDTIVWLCSRFRSAYVRSSLDQTLSAEQAARVRVRALVDRRYDETNWWRSRTGIKEFGFFWLRQLHSRCVDAKHGPTPYRNADAYERDVLASSGLKPRCWLDVGRMPHEADDVLILGGGENTRPFVAASLYKAGLARKILVTEDAVLPQHVDSFLPPFHEVNRNVLVNRGVPAADFAFLPASAENTYDEAVALAAFLKGKPTARVLVVTDDYHTRRSRWVFDRVLGRQADRLSFVSAPSIDTSDGWWRDEETFVALVTEFPKYAFYILYYGYFGYWMAACTVFALAAWWIRRHSYRNASIGSNREAFHAG
jgi:uncharacterized SAM-binding protein YcdF (DUF218 family)